MDKPNEDVPDSGKMMAKEYLDNLMLRMKTMEKSKTVQADVTLYPYGISCDPSFIQGEMREVLNEFKANLVKENNKYLSQHKEIEGALALFLGKLVKTQPENVVKFSADFFTQIPKNPNQRRLVQDASLSHYPDQPGPEKQTEDSRKHESMRKVNQLMRLNLGPIAQNFPEDQDQLEKFANQLKSKAIERKDKVAEVQETSHEFFEVPESTEPESGFGGRGAGIHNDEDLEKDMILRPSKRNIQLDMSHLDQFTDDQEEDASSQMTSEFDKRSRSSSSSSSSQKGSSKSSKSSKSSLLRPSTRSLAVLNKSDSEEATSTTSFEDSVLTVHELLDPNKSGEFAAASSFQNIGAGLDSNEEESEGEDENEEK